MATKKLTSTYEQVQNLIRPHLAFDDEHYRSVSTIGNIMATHGTGVDCVARLAVDGYFSGGHPDLYGEFFTTPNVLFHGWESTQLGREVHHAAKEKRVDAIFIATNYAGTFEHIDDGREDGYDNKINNGVVIALNGEALHPEAELYEDAFAEFEHAVELVLPVAPNIECIEGIYPVDEFAAKALSVAMQRIK